MSNHKIITIKQLDTGYHITSDDSEHAITSNDMMISKVRELFNISTKKSIPVKDKDNHNKDNDNKNKDKKDNPPMILEKTVSITKQQSPKAIIADKQTYGIMKTLSENGKWPIKQSDYLVPELISIPTNDKVFYAETLDGRIIIESQTGRIYTTWMEIHDMVNKTIPNQELVKVPHGFTSNQRTCIRQFMIAVRDGLTQGHSVELDPDKDFRKHITGLVMD